MEYVIFNRAEQGDDDDLQHRYVPLTMDGERTLSGVALPYNEVTEIRFFGKESFAPGAFGNLSRADVILDMHHDRSRPIARTGGGGLELSDSATELTLRAELPETRDANDALELVRSKIMRGFSIAFRGISNRLKDGVIHWEKAELIRVSLVDKPQYKGAKVNPRQEVEMTPEEIQRMIEEALANRSQDEPVDAAALANTIAGSVIESVQTQVREQVEAAFTERDEAQQQAAEAAEAQQHAEEEQRAAEERAEQERHEAETAAEERAELIDMVRDLLPEGTERRGQSNHDLLVLAVGDEVDDASNRSEDYLRAKVEGIIERRESAGQQRERYQYSGGANVQTGRVNIVNMVRQRARAVGGRK